MSRRTDMSPRLDPAAVAAKDVCVREIALSMSAGDWHQYRSALEYAVRHGLSEFTVADYAKEAARMLRIAWTDDATRVTVLERIQQLGRDAVHRREEVLDRAGNVVSVSKPDFRSAIESAKVVASILGMTRQQHELRVTYERMSDEQLMAEAVKFLELKDEHTPEGVPQVAARKIEEQEDDREEQSAGERPAGNEVRDPIAAHGGAGR